MKMPRQDASVERFMRSLAAEPLPPPPDASAVWVRAEFLRSLEAERRALLPLELAEFARGVAGIIVVSIWSVVLWSKVSGTPGASWLLVLSGGVVVALVGVVTVLLCRSAVEELRPIEQWPRSG